MSKFFRYFLLATVVLGLLLSTTVVAAGCGGTTTTTSATTTATQDSATVIANRALQVFSSNQVGGDWGANSISGTKLAQKLADPAQASGLYLLDIRSKSDYEAGHIKGAVQEDFAQWATADNLNKLPKDKIIVVICYTGNTAAQAASGMRMLGYNANVLKGGMNGWAQMPGPSGTQAVVADLQTTNYPDDTSPAGTSAPAPPATTFGPPSDADYKVIADKAASVMAAMPTDNNTVKPSLLNDLLNGADKPYVLDIRKTDDFNKGHIAGATHIDFAALALPENLKLLPKDKKIVVACYSGNTAAQAVTILRMLDYNAVVLKYGMMGWDGGGKDAYLTDIQNANNPLVTGSNGGTGTSS